MRLLGLERRFYGLTVEFGIYRGNVDVVAVIVLARGDTLPSICAMGRPIGGFDRSFVDKDVVASGC